MSGIDKMTEKSPASSIHSVEPVPSSFDGGSDTGPAASSVTDDHAVQPDNSAGDDNAEQDSSQPAAKSSAESSKPVESTSAVASEAAGANEMEKLSLSTLKELTVVSYPVCMPIRAISRQGHFVLGLPLIKYEDW